MFLFWGELAAEVGEGVGELEVAGVGDGEGVGGVEVLGVLNVEFRSAIFRIQD